MKCIIYRGIPGSGKSTLARRESALAFDLDLVFSTDNFFMKNGVYVFVPSKLPEYHAKNLRRFAETLARLEGKDLGDATVVVDNTNTCAWEIAPYAALASAYGLDVEVVTVLCDPKVAAKRCTHGVSEESIMRMHERLMREKLPKHWNMRTVVQ